MSLTAIKRKILVVDDEPHLVSVIRTRLEANQYEVITAHDGVEALEKVKSEKPHLILLDILMPRMDGSQFLHQMKVQGLLRNIPVIILTAKANMKEFFVVEGVVNIIPKPFESKNLLGEISRHLNVATS